MKKFLLSGFVLFAGFSSFAQNTVVTFEDLPLTAPDTFYNGSDEAGSFTSSAANVMFSNDFNTAWSSWQGFAYSNVVNTTTAGFQNQYAAFAGTGNAGSATYAIFNAEGVITFPSPYLPTSFKITNATYAALSMRDGDGFGKQFGTPTNGSGDVDGTDGKDFFKVWIYGLDANNVKLDSVEFYLADYRSNNVADHYILNTWETVDISSLGVVSKLSFNMVSSDNGDFGMNTPAYFAMDDLTFGSLVNVAQIAQENVLVYPNPVVDEVTIEGGVGNLTVLDLTGKVIASQHHNLVSNIDMSAVPAGMYLIQLNVNGAIVTHKIQK